MKFEVKNRVSGDTQFVAEIDCAEDALPSVKLGFAVKWAIKTGANLQFANLQSANLQSANLQSANLQYADLQSANLQYADLQSANLQCADLQYAYLRSADLQSADLQSANLQFADLQYADLQYADLQSANLQCANLQCADLRSANLQFADLQCADLQFAYLQYANLQYAKSSELVIAMTRILPDGDLIGWKKCMHGVIVKLRIPEAAKRSHAFGRKCRAEYADVIEVIGAKVGIAKHDEKTEYRAGQRITPDSFDENWQEECSNGIHFFITKIEAENY